MMHASFVIRIFESAMCRKFEGFEHPQTIALERELNSVSAAPSSRPLGPGWLVLGPANGVGPFF
jgi:hypothetical protein